VLRIRIHIRNILGNCIRIHIRIKVDSPIRIRINVKSGIRIRIKVKKWIRIRIGIRIKAMRIRKLLSEHHNPAWIRILIRRDHEGNTIVRYLLGSF
jgi:hypothetical protein